MQAVFERLVLLKWMALSFRNWQLPGKLPMTVNRLLLPLEKESNFMTALTSTPMSANGIWLADGSEKA